MGYSPGSSDATPDTAADLVRLDASFDSVLDQASGDASVDGRADIWPADLTRADQPDLASPDLPPLPDLAPPDQAPPDLALPDQAPPPDLALPPDLAPTPDLPPPPDTAPPDTGCVVPAGWWSTSYDHRRVLTITESAAGSLPQGYSVVAVLDTQALVGAGKMLPGGDDLRVVRQGVELDRRIVNPNTTSTEIWFRTQAAFDTSDATYQLYYGNPQANAPPAHWSDSMGADALASKVYLAADSFEDDAVGAAPNGWDGSSKYAVALDGTNKVLRVKGTSPNADYLFAGDYAWTDVVVQARLRVILTSGDHYGLFTRAESATNFDALWFGLQSNNQLALYTVTLSSSSATGLSSASTKGTWSISAAGTSWHTIAVRHQGQAADVLFDGAKKTTYNIPSSLMTHGRIGLCAGYPASEADWDDIVVRLYVSPEPAVSVAAEQSACP